MDPLVVMLILAAALLHASWNALIKSGGDPVVRLAVTTAASGLCLLPLLPFVGVPAPASWPYLLGSVAVHVAYYCFLALSYRVGDLSFVYPVARGAAPPLVAGAAFLFAGETLTPTGVIAVAVICGAIFSMTPVGRRGTGSGAALLFALCTAAAIAGYTVLDGLGARASGNVLGYIVYMFVLDALPFPLVVGLRRRRTLAAHLERHWRAGLVSGLLAAGAYGLVIWAMTLTPMTYVSALRETSVVLAAFIGSRLLREPFGAHRVVAASLVAVGVILLQFSNAG